MEWEAVLYKWSIMLALMALYKCTYYYYYHYYYYYYYYLST